MKGNSMNKIQPLASFCRDLCGAAAMAAALVVPAFSASAATAGAASAVAPAVAVPDQYRIGAGDTLHITVYQSPDLSLDARVNEAGVISYPLLGRVALGGLTVNAAEAHLAQALKKGEIVKDPQVIIAVTNVRANQVNVLGQVGHPGRLPLDLAGMHLTEVIALAGGVNNGAGSDTIVLIGQRGGKSFRHEADLPKIFAPGGSNDDIVVMPGDTIWVDRAPQIYLYGEIQHAGIQRLERGMTVMQAVAAGGGATARGTLKGLKVSRRGPDGRIQTIEPSMEDTLKDGDVMFIRESLF
jgi:polysaccharide export outer membrane protein